MSTASSQQRLIIVSNRLPVSAEYRGERAAVHPSVGGLATGLGAIYKDYRAMWVGWPGHVDPKDRRELDETLLNQHGCVSVHLPEDLQKKYYEGFSNDTVWPLFHSMPSYARYSAPEWEAYREVNALFCQAVLKVARAGDILWVHDYHLMLLPRLLRERLPSSAIGFFLHIPFPHYEMLRQLPWHKEIAESLLASDLIGFHTYDYVQSFLDSVRRLMGYDNRVGQITMGQRMVQADVFPMGIDVQKFEEAARGASVGTEMEKITRGTGTCKVIFTVARLDYTKGLPQTLSAIERFYAKYPLWKEKTVFLVVVVPSREGVSRYADLKRAIDEKIGALNSRLGGLTWTPITYIYRSLSFDELVAAYASADVFLALPLRDGMNLTVKEYLAARSDHRGALVLSEMAGAAKELLEALIVNPNNEEEAADALHTALTMPESERMDRNTVMRKRLETNNVKLWSEKFLAGLARVVTFSKELSVKMMTSEISERIMNRYHRAIKRLILLDYDGTLVSFSDVPQAAAPPKRVLVVLRSLASIPANRLALLSGRDKSSLEQWFGDVNAALVGEHGAWWKPGGNSEWRQTIDLSSEWKSQIRPILDLFVDRIPGSFVEEKEYSMVWHYRKADIKTGSEAARELTDTLTHLTANLDIHVLPGNKVVEVKSSRIGKGEFFRTHLAQEPWDFILAAGDDWTDENLFARLPPEAHSIRVGFNASLAKYNVQSPSDMLSLLEGLAEQDRRM